MEQVLGGPPRIEPLPDGALGEEAMGVVDKLRELHSLDTALPVHSVFRTLGKHEQLMVSDLELGLRFLTGTALMPRDRELAILRTGWLCGAPYEWGEHVMKAKEAGLTSEEIEWITEGSGATGWGADDRMVLKAAEELHGDAMISDETWALLAGRFDDRQLIELPMLVGNYHKVAFVQNSLRFQPRDENIGLMAR